MMAGAPEPGRAAAARVWATVAADGRIEGLVRLWLPAGHPSRRDRRCHLRLNAGLQLAARRWQRRGVSEVVIEGVGSGPLDLTLPFGGRWQDSVAPGADPAGAPTAALWAAAGDAHWLWPGDGGWFPWPGAVATSVHLVVAAGWRALLPGRCRRPGRRPTWLVPAHTPPTLLLGRWQVRPWSAKFPHCLLAAAGSQAPLWAPLLARVAGHFARRYGRWPYDILHVAHMPGLPLAGLSLPGLVLINPESATAGSEFDLAGLLAHEVAHQWWGNRHRPARAAEGWLVESLAEWERLCYLSAAYGAAAGRAVLLDGLGLYLAVARTVGPLTLDRFAKIPATDTLPRDALAYGPGLLLLHRLSRQLGAAACDRRLRQLALARTGTLALAALCRDLPGGAPGLAVDWSELPPAEIEAAAGRLYDAWQAVAQGGAGR